MKFIKIIDTLWTLYRHPQTRNGTIYVLIIQLNRTPSRCTFPSATEINTTANFASRRSIVICYNQYIPGFVRRKRRWITKFVVDHQLITNEHWATPVITRKRKPRLHIVPCASHSSAKNLTFRAQWRWWFYAQTVDFVLADGGAAGAYNMFYSIKLLAFRTHLPSRDPLSSRISTAWFVFGCAV